MPALLPSGLSAALFPRRTARHAKPSVAAPALAAGGLTAAFAVADGAAVTSTASAGGSTAQFERLADCESGGNWSINTGNGYYGGIQFNLPTWRGLGMRGYPHHASKATQIAAGQKLHSQRGWKPWPACSRKLGLSGDGGYSGSGSTAAPARESARASRSRRSAPVAAARTTAAPRFDGHVMTTADVRTYRRSVQTWQRRMAQRGWSIAADGYFGPRSSAVARSFARSKGLSARPGTVNRAVWDAAWTARVT